MQKKAQRVIRQHYVPRTYLKHFCADRDSKQIHVFDKQTEAQYRTSIDNVAAERFFYDIDQGDPSDEQDVEKYLSLIENVFASVLKRVTSSFKLTRSDVLPIIDAFRLEDMAEMSWYLAVQLLRTPSARNLMTEFSEKAMTAYARTQFKPVTFRKLQIKLKEDSIALNHAKFMLDGELIRKMAMKFANMIWIIGVNRSSTAFYTSDNPVVSIGHPQNDHSTLHETGQRAIEVLFPLNSDLTLILRDPEFFADDWSMSNRFVYLPDGKVSQCNELQVLSAHRQVFCSHADFDLARDINAIRPKSKRRISTEYLNRSAKKYFTSE